MWETPLLQADKFAGNGNAKDLLHTLFKQHVVKAQA